MVDMLRIAQLGHCWSSFPIAMLPLLVAKKQRQEHFGDLRIFLRGKQREDLRVRCTQSRPGGSSREVSLYETTFDGLQFPRWQMLQRALPENRAESLLTFSSQERVPQRRPRVISTSLWI